MFRYTGFRGAVLDVLHLAVQLMRLMVDLFPWQTVLKYVHESDLYRPSGTKLWTQHILYNRLCKVDNKSIQLSINAFPTTQGHKLGWNISQLSMGKRQGTP